MYKTNLILIFLMAATALHAQTTKERPTAESDHRVVINEDRGQAYLVTADTPPPIDLLKKHVELPQQFSIFVGDEWSSDPLRLLQSQLTYLSSSFLQKPEYLEAKATRQVGLFQQVPTGNLRASLSDLTIQGIIRD